jgi:hypothetical protein
MSKLIPLNSGEEGETGPPYLVNGYVVTRCYRPTNKRFWGVYSLDTWYVEGIRLFEAKTLREAIRFARSHMPIESA